MLFERPIKRSWHVLRYWSFTRKGASRHLNLLRDCVGWGILGICFPWFFRRKTVISGQEVEWNDLELLHIRNEQELPEALEGTEIRN